MRRLSASVVSIAQRSEFGRWNVHFERLLAGIEQWLYVRDDLKHKLAHIDLLKV